MYTKEVMKHFMHPKNMGEIKTPDGVGKVGNFLCGDIMWLYIKIGKNKKGEKIIKNIKFKTLGCPAAIASTSKSTEIATGKTIEDARKITKEDVTNSLGGLPPIKIHCSLLALDALNEAIYDYLSKNKLPIPKSLSEMHKRIQRELRMSEKKHKELVGE